MPTFIVTISGENVRSRRVRVKNASSERVAEQRALHHVQRQHRDSPLETREAYRRARATRVVKESD